MSPTAAPAIVLPGQPLASLAASSQPPAEAGKGAFSREATIFSSAIGSYNKTKAKDGSSIITVTGKESSTNVVPEIGSTVSRARSRAESAPWIRSDEMRAHVRRSCLCRSSGPSCA